jgi:hypothetical protein
MQIKEIEHINFFRKEWEAPSSYSTSYIFPRLAYGRRVAKHGLLFHVSFSSEKITTVDVSIVCWSKTCQAGRDRPLKYTQVPHATRNHLNLGTLARKCDRMIKQINK